MTATWKIIGEMTDGPVPSHKRDCELLAGFAARLRRAFKRDMARQYRRGYRHGAEMALRELDKLGGCDACEEWSKGWDAAVDSAYNAILWELAESARNAGNAGSAGGEPACQHEPEEED